MGDKLWEEERARVVSEELVFDREDIEAEGRARKRIYGDTGAGKNGVSPNRSEGRISSPVSEDGETSDSDSDPEVKRRKELFLLLAEMWGSFVGDEIQRQSLRCFLMEEPMEGGEFKISLLAFTRYGAKIRQDNVFVASTYGPIVDVLAAPLLKAGKVHLNSPVAKITSMSNALAQVTLANGSELKFDAVICTLPLGVLKHSSSVLFDPPLPVRVTEAINNLGYGTLEKVTPS